MLTSGQKSTTEAGLIRASVASRIATEVRGAGQIDQQTLAKVSSLLRTFRVPGRSTRLADVHAALAAEGIRMESGWSDDSGFPDIRRSGVVRLFDEEPRRVKQDSRIDVGIRLSTWRHGQAESSSAVRPVDVEPDDSVLWFDVDAPACPAEIETRATLVTKELGPWCRGLDLEMVRDLLREDPQPKVETYGDDHGSVRGVSVVSAIARELPGDDRLDGVQEQVILQLVELVVGDGWIVSCWHRSHICDGADSNALQAPLLKEPFLSDVRRQWQARSSVATHQSSSDLGMYLVQSLLQTYEATHRMMERWMARWEVEFYTSLQCADRASRLKEATGEISDFLYMTAEIRRKLTAFQHARWSTVDRSWFPALSNGDKLAGPDPEAHPDVVAVTGRLDSLKQNFDRLSGDIRANMDVLMLQSTATQQESSEKVQNYLGQVTGLVLVPTLIAGLFGANTALPGGGSWMGFELMTVLMIVSAVGVYLVIRRLTC